MNRRTAPLVVVLAVGVLVTCGAIGQTPTPMVYVYATRFEADGMRFESIDELRTYLLNAPNEIYGVFVRDCAAKGREQEVLKVVIEVAAQRGKDGPVNFSVGSVHCP